MHHVKNWKKVGGRGNIRVKISELKKLHVFKESEKLTVSEQGKG